MDYRNSEGSTGTWDAEKGFIPFKSQAEADGQAVKPEADDRTVSELTDALETAKVEIPSGAKKADLQKLAQQHGV